MSRLAIAMLALALAGCATAGAGEKGARWVTVEGPQRPEGRRFALVIGAGEFEDPRFTSLRYAERDATSVASALEGFERVVQLTGDQTRRPTVLAALDELLREASAPADTVLVYVSSHGSLAQRPGGGLERVIVTRDARLDLLLETGIPVEDVVHRLEQAGARRRLLILALCHSGKGKSQLPDSLARALAQRKEVPALEVRSEASIVLTACAFGETARESDELQHDVYTHFFLQGLEQGDLDGDGAVTASEAHDWARSRTYGFTQGAQRPTSEAEVLGLDPVVLRGKRRGTGKPVIFSYARSAEGLQVKVDGQHKGALPGSVALEPGSHQLALEVASDGHALYAGAVSLAPGERKDLSTLLPPPPSLELAVGLMGVGPLLGGPTLPTVPSALGVAVRGGIADVGVAGLAVEGFLTYLQGQSAEAGNLLEQIAVLARELSAEVGAGYLLPLGGGWRLGAIASAGGIWIGRERSTQNFSGSEGTLAPLASLRIRSNVLPGGPVFLGVGFQASVLWPRVSGAVQPAVLLGANLELGFAPR